MNLYKDLDILINFMKNRKMIDYLRNKNHLNIKDLKILTDIDDIENILHFINCVNFNNKLISNSLTRFKYAENGFSTIIDLDLNMEDIVYYNRFNIRNKYNELFTIFQNDKTKYLDIDKIIQFMILRKK